MPNEGLKVIDPPKIAKEIINIFAKYKLRIADAETIYRAVNEELSHQDVQEIYIKAN